MRNASAGTAYQKIDRSSTFLRSSISDITSWHAEACWRLGHPGPGSRILIVGEAAADLAECLDVKLKRECRIDTIETVPAHLLNGIRLGEPGAAVRKPIQYDLIACLEMPALEEFSGAIETLVSLLRPSGRLVVLAETGPRSATDKQLYEFFSEFGLVRIASRRGYRYGKRPPRFARSELVESFPALEQWTNSIAIVAEKPAVSPAPVRPLRVSKKLNRAVSVVVPCHNEEQNIEPLVQGLLGRYERVIHEIVLVDDNSTDGSRSILKRLASRDTRIKPVFRQPPNGVGLAIADGVRATTGRYVLTIDCDFQHILGELRGLFDAIADGYDAAFGSRFTPLSLLRNYPYHKLIANRSFNCLAQLILRCRFHDLTNNCKIMSGALYRSLVLAQPGFAVNAETGLLPVVLGYRVKEVPVSWLGRSYNMGQSTFRVWKMGSSYARVLFGIAWFRMTGRGPYGAILKNARNGLPFESASPTNPETADRRYLQQARLDGVPRLRARR
jgi:glycosyltransferase involved in cell wall biosynthesis